MSITRQQYESAAQAYLSKNPQLALKYYNPTLLKTLCDEMQSSLPTTVAAGIAFNRLVADGKIERTDGKSEDDDRAEARAAAQANLEKVISEVDSAPLSREELEYFSGLGKRELSRLYYGPDGDAVCEFAIRYRRAVREYSYVIPPKFGDQAASDSGDGSDDIELTAAQYHAMSAEQMKLWLRDPRRKAAIYRLIKAGLV